MHIPRGTFVLDKTEEVLLDGNYDTRIIKNKINNYDELYEKAHINCQAVYYVGNVISRTDTENIDDLIKLFIRYTHDPCKDIDLDTSVKEDKQMRWGTICPTKKVLFVHKSKRFIAYGRYIFGYDEDNVTFECKEREEKFRLENPSFEELGGNEYVYSFMIVDEETKVLDAFGLYR